MRQSRRPFLFVTRFTIAIVVCSLIVLFLYNRSDKGEDHIPHALIEIAPRLKHDARPVPQEPERVVDINGVTLKEIKRYPKPEDHPKPSIGSLQYRDQQFCTTYASRYEPYEDVNLSGSTYLSTYPRYKDDDGKAVDWTEKRLREDVLDAELLRLNHAAKPGKFIDWGSEIEQRRRKEDYQADRAFIIRASENYTWGRDDISNVRALIAELALRPSKAHSRDVYLMVDVWTKNVSFTMSDRQRERILATSVPREFWSIAHLTSEEQRAALYPGLVVSGKLLNHQSPVK